MKHLSAFKYKALIEELTVLGYLIVTKPVHTIKNDTMYFHTFIDAKGDWLDAVCFPQIATRYPVTGKGFYSMKGKVVEECRVYTVEVNYCKKVGIKERGQKGNELMKRDEEVEQGVDERGF